MTTTEPMPPLLKAYFADLDRALIGTDPREHTETVQAMREHAAEMLNRYGVSEQTAQRVITDFGPVEQVAAAATPAAAAAAAAERSWADIWLLVAAIAGLIFWVFPFIAVGVLAWAIVRIRRNTGNRSLQKAALTISGVSAVFSVGVLILRAVNAL